MLFPILIPRSLLVLWWPSLTKDMQTEQLLCWRGMTDTKLSTKINLKLLTLEQALMGGYQTGLRYFYNCF